MIYFSNINSCVCVCVRTCALLLSSVRVSPSLRSTAAFSSSSCMGTSLWLVVDSFWISSTDFSRSLENTDRHRQTDKRTQKDFTQPIKTHRCSCPPWFTDGLGASAVCHTLWQIYIPFFQELSSQHMLRECKSIAEELIAVCTAATKSPLAGPTHKSLARWRISIQHGCSASWNYNVKMGLS